jgi:protein phosphatase 1G
VTPTEIYCGNSGDSRGVLAKKIGDKITAIEMSVDHKPDNTEEK